MLVISVAVLLLGGCVSLCLSYRKVGVSWVWQSTAVSRTDTIDLEFGCTVPILSQQLRRQDSTSHHTFYQPTTNVRCIQARLCRNADKRPLRSRDSTSISPYLLLRVPINNRHIFLFVQLLICRNPDTKTIITITLVAPS